MKARLGRLITIGVWSMASVVRGQCVTYTPDVSVSAATSVGLTSGDSTVCDAISGAATIWNNCASSGIPSVNANGSGSLAVEVIHIAGPSTRSNGACGQGEPVKNSLNQVVGGRITVWDSWGSGAGALAGTDCTASFAGLIAHELGHVFGLENSSCDFYIMGGGWTYMTTPNSQECAAVDAYWTTPSENPPLPSSPPPTTCHTCGGLTEPLALDLNGDGVIATTSLSRPVLFDLDADGNKEWITWLDPAGGDGFLWLDIHPNHQVDSGFELFGVGMILPSGRHASSGFEALAVYDTAEMGGNEDGEISVGDKVWGRLRLWVDANGDGVAQERDEIFTLAQRGIERIALDYSSSDQFDANGNNHFFRSVFTQARRSQERSLPIHGLIFQPAPPP